MPNLSGRSDKAIVAETFHHAQMERARDAVVKTQTVPYQSNELVCESFDLLLGKIFLRWVGGDVQRRVVSSLAHKQQFTMPRGPGQRRRTRP